MLKIAMPRLLPATIVALAALLLLKCEVLLQAAVVNGHRPDGMMVGAANAASTEHVKEPAKPEHGSTGKPKEAVHAPPPPVPEGPPPVSDSERALLQDLRQRRQDLDARAAVITTRESVLFATEQKLTMRLTELQTLQKKLEGLDGAQKQKEDVGWQGLVKLYETMKPKEAATIFNDLAMPVLLQLLDRMKEAKAAVVMAAMNPDRVRDVTAELAQMRTGRDASGAPIAGTKANIAGG